MADWFWKRDNLYLKNGKCVYAEECDECTENCNPEKCELFEAKLDAEVQADEILMDT